MQILPKVNTLRKGSLLYRSIRYRKGFGVHSPFVFNLITKVIEEKCSYYSFYDIELYVSSYYSRKERSPIQTGRTKETKDPFHQRDRKTGIHPAQAWRLIIPFGKLFQVQEYPPDRNHDGVVYLISNLLCHGIEMYRLGKCTGIRHDRPSSIR